MRKVTKNRILSRLSVPLLLTSLILAAIQPALAQGTEPIIAGVDRMELSTDETLTLTVVVNAANQNVPRPELPDLIGSGFSIAGNSTTSQMSFVNGAVSNNVVYSYRLQPFRTGTLTIEPVTLALDGQTYLTDPIDIQVTQGTGQAQAPSQSQQDFKAPSQLGNNDLYVEALVDNLEPYVGEQIVFTFRYYEAMDAMRSIFSNQPDYQPPALTGFWAEGDIDVTSYRAPANGRLYTVTELTQVLFPTAPGEEIIESARIILPGGGFSQDVILDTEPVTVDVQSLPAGAPESFTGAVGQFDIWSELDAIQTRVDEPVTLQVTLYGQGNISTAADPIWPEMDGWRTFESDSTLNTQVENGFVTGSHTYERLLVPTEAGDFTIPPIEYSFFDPTAGNYRTISTDPLAMLVSPGAGGATSLAAMPEIAGVNALTADDVKSTALASLKPMPAALEVANPPLTTQTWYWLLWGVPLAALAGGYVWRRRQAHLEQNAAAVRSSRALKNARKAIGRARKQRGSDAKRYVAANKIMTKYLSAKLDQPVAGKTNDAIIDALVEQGIDMESYGPLVHRALACLDSYEHNRYSPAGVTFATPDQLLDEIETVVDELDTIL